MRFGIIAIALTVAVVAGTTSPRSPSVGRFATCDSTKVEDKKVCKYHCLQSCDNRTRGGINKICKLGCGSPYESRSVHTGIEAESDTEVGSEAEAGLVPRGGTGKFLCTLGCHGVCWANKHVLEGERNSCMAACVNHSIISHTALQILIVSAEIRVLSSRIRFGQKNPFNHYGEHESGEHESGKPPL
ncbi:hypothetical protein P3342_011187 [Pyrenophora teres f. teres]|uniref:Uncharacterized protein n=1 Tax=Pyrenophora teres f. teres TaxID=97479 RepID=A0A6S6WML9_9PLEO|nr:hypothetical protein PTNB85_09364 [Pyrenophora teres f. teres]KAE8831963.1 hypothetical protein HRS9139_06205 [Pyrenophora teres f. teres]KAE8835301.1 hypothetical protein HRS9122_07571 [Pyrenophora teres f. teres]KAE8858201.1 hypothetical protein PTNB29_07416 [Pyrenophora teres f. teres]KAE8861961.1 hypothetical protein PTNB73_07515 [Pyrenophora teres f. teres]